MVDLLWTVVCKPVLYLNELPQNLEDAPVSEVWYWAPAVYVSAWKDKHGVKLITCSCSVLFTREKRNTGSILIKEHT